VVYAVQYSPKQSRQNVSSVQISITLDSWSFVISFYFHAMSERRRFLKTAGIGAAALIAGSASSCASNKSEEEASVVFLPARKPITISTWKHGMPCNAEAWKILEIGGHALDAVEKGVMVTENDPESTSVGYGGRPDREGKVTLDACIQNEKSDCGAVSFLQDMKNPIAVARKVMEETPHVMLSGAGARQFAIEKGFEPMNLLTEESEKAWKEWLIESQYKPVINVENHDTIGILALDAEGRLCGACTTSGAAYKLHGRVGDSPIIGAGLFVDNEVGGACATGLGEAVIRVSGSAMVVELMRNGATPQEACVDVVNRIIRKHDNLDGLQVGFMALNMNGEFGAYSVYEGFDFACTYEGHHDMVKADFDRKWD
jgi:N4-(beta-N-acetylglucosaminyl)-L-asparaginase